MPHATRCRLIFDESASGVWNMAVDEALLDQAANGDPPTLRFYSWSEPTLSLGYFQAYEDRQSHAASLECPVVRRSTGGGAILHDHEITYSLALPPQDPRGRDAVALTCLIHHALIEALTDSVSGFTDLSTCGQGIPGADRPEPFLCFQRRSPGDVVATDKQDETSHKLCGSAQRRRRGALLQHGGVLLARSDDAPELPGVKELTGSAAETVPLTQRWSRKILSSLGLEAEPGETSSETRRLAEQIASQRFANPTWTGRR